MRAGVCRDARSRRIRELLACANNGLESALAISENEKYYSLYTSENVHTLVANEECTCVSIVNLLREALVDSL